MIDQKLQSYYEDRFSMMATQGWTDLIDDVDAMHKSLNQVMPIQNEAELHLRRGQLDILNWILTLQESSSQSYEQLMSGDSGE